MGPLISGKSSLVKYYNLARYQEYFLKGTVKNNGENPTWWRNSRTKIVNKWGRLQMWPLKGRSEAMQKKAHLKAKMIMLSWNPKQPFINGCFNWMIPNLYIGNGCFTKHPFFNSCLGFQDGDESFFLSNFLKDDLHTHCIWWVPLPIASMYGIFSYIYHTDQPNVG